MDYRTRKKVEGFIENAWLGFVLFNLLGMFFGLIIASADREGCEYKTIVSRANPAFFVACEIMRPRF